MRRDDARMLVGGKVEDAVAGLRGLVGVLAIDAVPIGTVVRVERGRVEAVEEIFGRSELALPFLDPLDPDRADTEPVHVGLLGLRMSLPGSGHRSAAGAANRPGRRHKAAPRRCCWQ